MCVFLHDLKKLENFLKTVTRFRKLKYMAARRKFKEALRPYDVKDVIGKPNLPIISRNLSMHFADFRCL